MSKDYDVRDLGLAAQGVARIEWAEHEMPVLRLIRERFAAERPLAGYRLAACLHVTSETANLARTLKESGAEVYLCDSNPLSTQDDVAAALAASGINVYAWYNATDREYRDHLLHVLDTGPRVVIDDGGDLVGLLHTARREQASNVAGGCEETTTGVRRLEALDREKKLLFPMLAVNDALCKFLFDNRYGTGESVWSGIMRTTNLVVAGKTVVVLGYGWCGKGVAMRAKGLGANVIVCEVDPVRAAEAAMDGFEVARIEDVLDVADFFITATGNKDVITVEHLARMKDKAVVGNVGHFDNEIDMAGLAAYPGIRRTEIKPQVHEWTFPADDERPERSIIVLSEGRLMNLGNATGHPSFVMSNSFSNQVIGQIELFTKRAEYPVGVYRLPKVLDEKVARLHLDALGVRLTQLSKDQAEYLGIDVEGPFKPEHYRY